MKEDILNQSGDVKYITFPIFQNCNIVAVYTTKLGGVSTGYVSSMNLKFDLEPNKENVMQNYKIISNAIGVPYEKLTFSNQKHETNIKIINETDIGKGISKEIDYDSVDALITNIKNVPIVTFYADCVPIYIYDKEKNVIAMAHAGWKGTVNNIVGKTIDELITKFHSNTSNLLCAIGPSICSDCYKVSDDVKEAVNNLCNNLNIENTFITSKSCVDLKKINFNIMKKYDINPKNIFISKMCTNCEEEIFFSHRRQGIKRGSQVGIMMIR